MLCKLDVLYISANISPSLSFLARISTHNRICVLSNNSLIIIVISFLSSMLKMLSCAEQCKRKKTHPHKQTNELTNKQETPQMHNEHLTYEQKISTYSHVQRPCSIRECLQENDTETLELNKLN